MKVAFGSISISLCGLWNDEMINFTLPNAYNQGTIVFIPFACTVCAGIRNTKTELRCDNGRSSKLFSSCGRLYTYFVIDTFQSVTLLRLKRSNAACKVEYFCSDFHVQFKYRFHSITDSSMISHQRTESTSKSKSTINRRRNIDPLISTNSISYCRSETQWNQLCANLIRVSRSVVRPKCHTFNHTSY